MKLINIGKWNEYYKHRQLRIWNQIIDNLDFKLSKFGQQYKNNSDSNFKIVSLIANLINF